MFNNQYNNNNFMNYNLINNNTFNNLNINNHLFYNNYNNNINNTWPFISKHPNLNDFIEIKNLGNGANGSVIKVQNKIDKKYYAMKKIKKIKNKEKEIDYLREKEILYKLTKSKENSEILDKIIKLYYDFEDNKYRYLIMEYCDGVNLLHLNKACLKMKETNPNYHIPEKIIIYILKQMLEILDFLHNECNIIHRDIKPNNILIDKHYKVKLIDFGLSTYLIGDNNNNLVTKNSYKGSVKYVPPEILYNNPPKYYDFRFDIFSLGFTIYNIMFNNNLPKNTIKSNNKYNRIENHINNNFYSEELIRYV